MSCQECGGKRPSLEGLSTSDLIKILSSKLKQSDARERILHLKDLEGVISAERRDLNARVAINRLPAEVLREIFVTTCAVKLAQYRPTYYGCDDIATIWNPTWIDKGRAVRLMLVCYRWKEIVLGIRELWNGIETYWQDEDHILFERSHRGPLKVLACDELEPSYAVAHALQNVEHSSRIQELYWITPFRQYLRMPAPSLRSLALHGYRGGSVPDGSFKLFDNDTPCLEHLSLSRLHWLPGNAFAKLTFLALDKCEVPKAPIKLRSMLAGTPDLVDLILRDVIDNSNPFVPSRVETEPADMKPVSLVRLRRLLIEDMWIDDIDYVFRDAQLNEDMSVSIKAMSMYDSRLQKIAIGRVDEQRLLEMVSSWSLNALKQPKELHFQKHVFIVVGASSGLRYEVDRCTTPEDWTAFNWTRILPLSSISHLCTFAWGARKRLGLECVRNFRLECIRNLLRQTIRLKTLSINIKSLTKIDDTLALFQEPTDPPLCPALTTLRIAIHKDSDCDIILDSILPHRAQLAIKHLYVGLVNPENGHWTPRQIVKDQLQGNFESVEFETLCHRKAYDITLPLVCDEEAHALWPPWLYHI